jgi:hypothetical protein
VFAYSFLRFSALSGSASVCFQIVSDALYEQIGAFKKPYPPAEKKFKKNQMTYLGTSLKQAYAS